LIDLCVDVVCVAGGDECVDEESSLSCSESEPGFDLDDELDEDAGHLLNFAWGPRLLYYGIFVHRLQMRRNLFLYVAHVL
jgi:hypothetical protein